MAHESISVKLQALRESEDKVKTQSSDTPYHKNDLGEYLSGNGGDACNGLLDINSNTDICVNVTRQLIECTSRFLRNAADTFETVDYSIAQEVSNN